MVFHPKIAVLVIGLEIGSWFGFEPGHFEELIENPIAVRSLAEVAKEELADEFEVFFRGADSTLLAKVRQFLGHRGVGRR